ncbi:MAG: bifunctional pyr operon transcriptional regulator/uracil phosphoribosyltransferase PyrR [Clostridia bacterium]|nr:bifunctional pyr operon transcriptional regulator/uracil phosphoribosyltransferase PyrR [Clostridia bacterium]
MNEIRVKEKAVLLEAGLMDRALTRIAHEILEKNKGCDGLLLLGIVRRGVPLAERIAEKIKQIEGIAVPVGRADITFYRDDLSKAYDQPLCKADLGVEVTGKTVVLVDDVIYTGRTVRAAVEAVFSAGRPAAVRLAVMIDRGLRELPFHPDFVGKNVPTSHNEVVLVKVKEIDGKDEVALADLTR